MHASPFLDVTGRRTAVSTYGDRAESVTSDRRPRVRSNRQRGIGPPGYGLVAQRSSKACDLFPRGSPANPAPASHGRDNATKGLLPYDEAPRAAIDEAVARAA